MSSVFKVSTLVRSCRSDTYYDDYAARSDGIRADLARIEDALLRILKRIHAGAQLGEHVTALIRHHQAKVQTARARLEDADRASTGAPATMPSGS